MMATLGWRIFLRSLLVQSSWNFAGQQNLGFLFMVWPALSRRGLGHSESARAGLRQLDNFNTHPYFAGLIAGTVIRNEERGVADAALTSLKRSLMCALGAIGDEFFWATLRPFAALVALPAALAGAVWAPLIMLAVYNVPHLSVRIWAIRVGLGGEGAVMDMLRLKPLSRALPALGVATTALTGFLVGASAINPTWGLLPGHGLVSAGIALCAFMLLLGVQIGGLGQGRLVSYLSAVTALAALVLVVSGP